jgi:PAS domain S-box-containing protein
VHRQPLPEWITKAGFAIALATLAAVGINSYWSLEAFLRAQSQMQHSHDVIGHLKDLLVGVTAVESASRGYVLAGKGIYLAPFQSSLQSVAATLHELRAATEGDGRQRRSLPVLEALIQEKLNYHSRIIDLRKQSGPETALDQFVSGRGQRLMDQIGSIIQQMTDAETAVLASSSLEAQKNGKASKLAVFAGVGISLLILVAVYIRLIREIHARRASARRLEHLNRLYVTLTYVEQAIVSTRDRKSLWEKVCRVAVDHGGLRMAWVGLLEETRRVVKPAAICGQETGYVPASIPLDDSVLGNGPTATSIRTGKHVVCSNVAEDPRMLPWREEALRRDYLSSAAFPIVVAGRPIAAFCVYASETGFFDDEITALFDEIAGNVAFAVENIDREADRLTAERMLRESEQRLRQIAENIEELFWTTNADLTQVLYVSPVYERMWGLPCESVYRDPASLLAAVHSDDRRTVEKQRSQAVSAGSEWSHEFRVVRPDGSVRWVWDRGFPIRGEQDAVLGYAGITQDITERRHAEDDLRDLNQELEARVERRTAELAEVNRKLIQRNSDIEKASRMKNEFLARVSHEFRTPLNAIVGYSDLLREEPAGPLSDTYRRFIRNIHEGAQHLTEMVNDLLDLSRIEAGRLELHLEHFPIASALDEVLAVIAPLAQMKSLALEDRVEPGTEITADRVRLKQILYNLISNAVKFTPEEGRVWIEAALENETLTICVGDTGVGIPPDEQEAIFEEFHQVADTKAASGAGLGLAITRKLAQLHGGTVRVESRPAEGSRFFVILPGAAAASAGPPERKMATRA